MGIVIEPLEEISFKWEGLSSILISGPVNTGYYEPLPLPSTIYGFLKYAYAMKDLKGQEIRFKGPLFYADFEDLEALCAHVYPRGLACSTGREKLCYVKLDESVYKHKIGIALKRDSKITKEDYIYITKMISFNKLARLIYGAIKGEGKEPKLAGVYVDVDDAIAKSLDGFVGPFGGESRLAKIRSIQPTLKRSHRRVMASPAFIDTGNFEKIYWEENFANIKTLGNELERRANLKIIFRVLSMGFEINNRLPMHLAIMPSLLIEDIEIESVGKYSNLGWGSIIEL